jgi:hypothetical protein
MCLRQTGPRRSSQTLYHYGHCMNNVIEEMKLIFETIRNVALAASILLVAKYISENPQLTFNIPTLQAIEIVIVVLLSGYLQVVNICCYFYQTKQQSKNANSKIHFYLGSAMMCIILVHMYIAIGLSTLKKLVQ